MAKGGWLRPLTLAVMRFGFRGVGKKKWAAAALAMAALVLLVIYELLLGRLFPFSPVVVGFSRQEYGRYVLYHHGQPESSQLSYLNDVVAWKKITTAWHSDRSRRYSSARMIANIRGLLAERQSSLRSTDDYLCHSERKKTQDKAKSISGHI